MNSKEIKPMVIQSESTEDITERERYLLFTTQDERIVEFRKHISQVVAARGLGSFMNDTKWLALQEGIKTLPFPPAYTDKRITDVHPPADSPACYAPTYYGDWHPFYKEGMALFFNIEWLRIYPRRTRGQGLLVPSVVQDITPALIALLERLHIYFEEDKGAVIIWGYR